MSWTGKVSIHILHKNETKSFAWDDAMMRINFVLLLLGALSFTKVSTYPLPDSSFKMPQAAPTPTEASLAILSAAEQKILSALSSAHLAITSLSPPTQSASQYALHAKSFLKDLSSAQALLRLRISNLSPDLPLESSTLRRLVEADLAAQRTAHVHRSLVRALLALDEAPVPGPSSAAASPSWMPSPVAHTPLAVLGGAAGSPPAAAAAITIAVPTPDAAGNAELGLRAAALNGGLGDGEEPERMEL